MYRTAIIGLGSIGGNKSNEIDYPGSPNILTHANAVNRHPKTELAHLIESDNDIREKVVKKWKPESHVESIDRLLIYKDTINKPDIVIIATPTETHLEIAQKAAQLDPKLIIIEKPCCINSSEARELKKLDIPIMVNYNRRFVPEYQKFTQNVHEGRYGKCLNTRVLYTRGLKRDGCHAIDLMHMFFGEWTNTPQQTYGTIINDYSEEDPTLPLMFEFERCQNVIFQPCDGRAYGVFEIDMCFEKGRFRFVDNGLFLERYPIIEENEWGHKALSYSSLHVNKIDTFLNQALYHLIDNAIAYLNSDGKIPLRTTLQDAINVHWCIEGI